MTEEDEEPFRLPPEAREEMDALEAKWGNEVRPRYYDIDGNPISFADWAETFENRYRGDRNWWRPGDTLFADGVHVSTVWLGLDHSFGGRPLIFETMIFGGPHDQYQERHSTWTEAEQAHTRIVKALEAGEDPTDTSDEPRSSRPNETDS